MKKIIIGFLLVLFAASTCLAGSLQDKLKGVLEKKNGASAPAAFTCTGQSDKCESLDNTATVTCTDDDAGTQANCYLAWTRTGSTTDLTITNQATGLEGTYAKKLTNNTQGATTNTRHDFGSNASEKHAFALIKMDTLTAGGTSGVVAVPLRLRSTDNAGNVLGLGVGTVSGAIKWMTWCQAAGSWVNQSTGPSAGTVYGVWLDYVANTASTGCSIYVAAATCADGACTVNKPAALYQASSSSDQTRYGGASVANSATTGVVNGLTIDKIRFGAAAYGDNGNP